MCVCMYFGFGSSQQYLNATAVTTDWNITSVRGKSKITTQCTHKNSGLSQLHDPYHLFLCTFSEDLSFTDPNGFEIKMKHGPDAVNTTQKVNQ